MGSQDQNPATETYFNTETNVERVQTKEEMMVPQISPILALLVSLW